MRTSALFLRLGAIPPSLLLSLYHQELEARLDPVIALRRMRTQKKLRNHHLVEEEKSEKRRILVDPGSAQRKRKEKDAPWCDRRLFLTLFSGPDNLLSTCQIYPPSLWEDPDPRNLQ